MELGNKETNFVYHKHIIGDKHHFDLRYLEGKMVKEFNLYGDIRNKGIEEPVEATKKHHYDLTLMDIKKEERRKMGDKWTIIEPLDEGEMVIMEDGPNFISCKLEGKILKGRYIAKRIDTGWVFEKGKLPK